MKGCSLSGSAADERLPETGARPNLPTFGAAISAVDAGRDWSWAIVLMEDEILTTRIL